MSRATRLAATALLSLCVGAAGGAYATRLLYGESAGGVDPSPETQRTCPPCPDCPLCPEPPPCDTVSVLPDLDLVDQIDTATDADAFDEHEAPGFRPPDPDLPRGPGLSAGAIQQAFSAVRVAVAPCLAQAEEDDSRGMVLLTLTVTATGAEGFVTDAVISQRSGDVERVEDCVRAHATRARFRHKGGDGSQRVKVPLRIGD